MKTDLAFSVAALALVLLILEYFYFAVARRYAIIDKPNERSSHSRPVIRGGGVIIVIAVWIWFFYQAMSWPWFVTGFTAVAIVSFFDDIMSVPALVRFMIHLAATTLVFYQLSLFTWPVALIVLAAIVCIAAINAFNFMDGINGITGLYGLVSLFSFLYIHYEVVSFTTPSFLIIVSTAVVVFLFFNLRKKARCFAGDVGSVGLAFILVFLMLQLIKTTGQYGWALLFLVFGTDSVITIIYRLRRKENIFRPHRSHLYQYLTNELKMGHLPVSGAYAVIQILVNILVIQYFRSLNWTTVAFLAAYIVLYVMIREAILRHMSQRGLVQKVQR